MISRVSPDAATRAVRRFAARSALACTAYVLLDWVSYVHAVEPLGITPWNPTAGLLVAMLMRWGWPYAPVAAIAPIVADYIVRGGPADFWTLVAGAAVIGCGYASAVIVLRSLGLTSRLESLRDIGWLAAVASVAALLVGGAYVSLFIFSGYLPRSEWWSSILRYWVGDLNGILVLAPALLLPSWMVGTGNSPNHRPWAAVGWIGMHGVSIAVALWIVFGWSATDEFKFFYLLFLPVIWAALRWGLPGAAITVVATQAGLVIAVEGVGYSTNAFIEFQALMLALASTALALGVVVSERQRARADLLAQQAALNRALQFATAGEMTATMAHEVNNPIAALSAYLQSARIMAERAGAESAPVMRILDKAIIESRRASDVVRKLREAYGANKIHIDQIDIATLCAGVVDALRPQANSSNVAVVTQFPSFPMPVAGDEFQLFVALRNLIDNAIAASEGHGERRVCVAAMAHPGGVEIRVDDSGPGFEFDANRISFEAMQSTKPGGMGLGLAIAKRVVVAHHGTLACAPRDDGGSRFSIFLPNAGPGTA